ncbi:hypothetical protein BCR43DRAFT_524473 [Syncephalastrum racemosum]|uniref:Chitin-binding type-2 domain-containing protein n=1 Tax=Syncephalastrum racemosum TaxID=13706 RepID=A0A1X2HC32_SYNRA|nr:hypothetical protein BCR43DRAFT_524473 [Syncephalastrum racemosum]
MRDDVDNTAARFCGEIASAGGPQVLSHPGSCTKFIVCENTSSPVAQDCPAGLHFNPSLSVCDYPENVACDANQAPQLLAAQQRAAYMSAASASAASASVASSSAFPSASVSSSAFSNSAVPSSAVFSNLAWA